METSQRAICPFSQCGSRGRSPSRPRQGRSKVEWEPKVNRWTGAEIQAVLKGAERLEGPWADVPEGGETAFRFFKVVVEGP